jgi:hypothetical protein
MQIPQAPSVENRGPAPRASGCLRPFVDGHSIRVPRARVPKVIKVWVIRAEIGRIDGSYVHEALTYPGVGDTITVRNRASDQAERDELRVRVTRVRAGVITATETIEKHRVNDRQSITG